MTRGARFDKILVANRGEIAVRILRTARALGYATVAVFSDADADAPHVRMADLAVSLGGQSAATSYLRADLLVDAALRSGAQAVHPGYGFLAENAGFAEACLAAGLVFIGPSPAAIAAMGDKVVAKKRMAEAGVPVAPGFDGGDQSAAALASAGRALGVPLLVKAVAGGGGRGMRRVTDLADLDVALQSARTEAQSAFGNGDVFLERLVLGGRHIEVQVFADEHGNAIHLGERECSAQRRHQKVIEEAPSPVVDASLRARLGQAAVAAAKAIDYRGAGTVEFLLGDDGDFFFLEMNTRLQVEHPVTELVTGTDLVAWQIDIAQGLPLPIAQDAMRMQGHAIEARLYAEDPEQGFLPQAGPVLRFTVPAREGVRVDTGVVTGSWVTPHYDPMIAKIIAHGPDRETARRRLVAALNDTTVLGLKTNRCYLAKLLADPQFKDAEIRTDTLDARGTAGLEQLAPTAEQWAVAAALMVSGASLSDAWRTGGPLRAVFELRASGDVQTVTVSHSRAPGELTVSVGDSPAVELVVREAADPGSALVGHKGCWRTVRYVRAGRELHLHDGASTVCFEEPDPVAASASEPVGELVAPLSGTVLSVSVQSGSEVSTGDTLLVVEAMKMEHRVVAQRSGVVRRLTVSVGDQVRGGEMLLTIEESE